VGERDAAAGGLPVDKELGRAVRGAAAFDPRQDNVIFWPAEDARNGQLERPAFQQEVRTAFRVTQAAQIAALGGRQPPAGSGQLRLKPVLLSWPPVFRDQR